MLVLCSHSQGERELGLCREEGQWLTNFARTNLTGSETKL
jgi:hypothetical protein